MKALSVEHNFPITPDLWEISNLIRSNVLTSNDLNRLSPDFRIATGSANYNETEYPDNNPSYWSSLSRKNITNAISAATMIDAGRAIAQCWVEIH